MTYDSERFDTGHKKGATSLKDRPNQYCRYNSSLDIQTVIF
jgi:hypothetical protein